MFDVIVIGAGPAGAAAATTLAKLGNNTLLVDQKEFPREKVCGDGLIGYSHSFIKSLGIWEKLLNKGFLASGISLNAPDSDPINLEAETLMLRRSILDNHLVRAAYGYGANLEIAKFAGEIADEDGFKSVRVISSEAGDENILRAKVVIFATGCNGDKVLRRAGFENLKKPDMVAIRGYWQADWDLNRCLVFFDRTTPDAYYWIFPMGQNVFNIGYGCRLDTRVSINIKDKLFAFVEANEKVNEFISSGECLVDPMAARLRSNLSNIQYSLQNNCLLAGEALGTTLPFTGEGIGKAMQSGVIAAEVAHRALKNNDLSLLGEYPLRLRREQAPSYLPYRMAERLNRSVITRKTFFSLLRRSSRLRRKVVGLLDESIHPKEVFSVKGAKNIIFNK